MNATKHFGRVDTIIASAGTGKTYTLVERIKTEIIDGLPPRRLLATTFTKKAAAELSGRIRSKLIEERRPDLAAAMLSARIGTVNSICGSLIAEFAFELGRSPKVEVITEASQKAVFERAIAPAIVAFAGSIQPLASAFGIEAQGYDSKRGKVFGWQDDVRRIVDLARSNGITSEGLAASADHSVGGLLRLLPRSALGETAANLDEVLSAALLRCADDTERAKSSLKSTTLKKDMPCIADATAPLRRGEALRWSDWARLSKLGATKADKPLFSEVIEAASAHPRHPRLRHQLEQFIRLQFACAGCCLRDYEAYKRARGLVDFVDQEMLALEILQDPSNSERLREMIGAVFVDEFQDSSPIQIAIFSALAAIVPVSTWVGDPKQSIYGFRNADPVLTYAASGAITQETGGDTEFLRTSYRTHPALGSFANSAFAPNFLRAGMRAEEVTFDAYARTGDEDAAALSVWPLAGARKEDRTNELAAYVSSLLAEAKDWRIHEKDGTGRAPLGSDIAILCRTNAQASDLAAALVREGLKVAVERAGLLNQPEAELALAIMRWIADPSDALAVAEVARLTGDGESWWPAAFDADPIGALKACVPAADAIDGLRAKAAQLTPAEMFDCVLHLEGILPTIVSWGEAEQRLANLEALRAAFETYQEEQCADRRAATLVGAVEWLANRTSLVQPASLDPDAVQVITYHGSKGLEWPIVVLADLDAEAKADPFGVRAEQTVESDWRDPLAGRILRYWIWPYGMQKSDVGLDAAAAASVEGVAALERERLERTRLLYVGMTRAKDYMVLTLAGDKGVLDELRSDDGSPVVDISPNSISVDGGQLAVRNAPVTSGGKAPGDSAEYLRPLRLPRSHLPLRIRPSAHQFTGDLDIVETVTLGNRIALTGQPDLQAVGEAFHRFIASDDVNHASEVRYRRAEGILRGWQLPQLAGGDLLIASDRLHNFLEQRFESSPRRHEWPVYATIGDQVIAGRIDLFVELEDRFVIIDHKAFPGSFEIDRSRLQAFAGQVHLYAMAVEGVSARRGAEFWIHQPAVGKISRVSMK